MNPSLLRPIQRRTPTSTADPRKRKAETLTDPTGRSSRPPNDEKDDAATRPCKRQRTAADDLLADGGGGAGAALLLLEHETPHAPTPYSTPNLPPRRFSECLHFLRGLPKTAVDPKTFELHPLQPNILLMNGWGGGNFFVPDDEYARFLELYAQDIGKGIELYISEQRSAVFRMHLDLDFMLPVRIPTFTRNRVVEMIQVIQREMKRFYPTTVDVSSFAAVVSTAPLIVKKRVGDDGGWVDVSEKERKDAFATTAGNGDRGDGADIYFQKLGMHVVFPALLVDSIEALTMRESFVCALQTKYGTLCDECPWDDIVDHRVYTTNGLRMNYSRKIEKCPQCKIRARTQTLKECKANGTNAAGTATNSIGVKTNGTKTNGRSMAGDAKPCSERKQPVGCPCCGPGMRGKWDAGRSYDPLVCLDGEGRIDREATDRAKQNVHYCVRQTSIHCNADKLKTQGWKLYKGAPRFSESLLSNQQRRERQDAAGGSDASAPVEQVKTRRMAADGGTDSRTMRMMAASDPRTQLLLAAARAVHPMYRNLNLRGAYRHAKGHYYTLQVAGQGSSFCLNLVSDGQMAGNDHNSVSIYFLVTPKGTSQRCYCRCNKTQGRLYGLCYGFKSLAHPLSKHAAKTLFPPSETAAASATPSFVGDRQQK